MRRVLDEAGLDYVRVLVSGGLDEFQVDELVQAGAPIDAFGVGTRMAVSGDAPWLDMAYKLVKYAGRPVLKLSTGKVSLADEKQVFRLRDDEGRLRAMLSVCQTRRRPNPALSLCWRPSWRTAKCWLLRLRLRS